jgi:hypothetical protein
MAEQFKQLLDTITQTAASSTLLAEEDEMDVAC